MDARYESADSRWRAVQRRDPLAATAFVYAVKTTHIYCRPTCPSRLARRANVTFYKTSAAARAAAFRPCKRCKPDQALEPRPALDLVAKACARIVELHGELTIDDLARDMMVSSRHLRSVFNSVKQCTPVAYAAMIRQMQRRECTMSDVAGYEEDAGLDALLYSSQRQYPDLLTVGSTSTTESTELREIEFYYSPSSYEQIGHLSVSVDGDVFGT